MTQVIKIPGINGLGKTEGCQNSGNAIIEVLREIYTNEQGKQIDVSKLDLEEIHLDNKNLPLTNELIYKNSVEAYEIKSKVIFLGGDHSVSFSTTKAFLDYCNNSGKTPCLIVFDAHPDCMPVTKGAENFPTHEEWLRGLVEYGFPPENILIVGVRNSYKDELDFLKEKGVRIVSVNKLLTNLEDTTDTIMEFSSGKELYVSIDIDVIDPRYAPATGYKEPGGLTSREFIYIIQRINKIKNLKAVDLVEINSEKDKEFDNVTVKLGGKILSELL